MSRHLAIVALVLATGCTRAEAIPEDLDAVLSAYWLEFRTADDERLVTITAELPGLVDMDALADKEERGEPARLGAEHMEVVEFYGEAGGSGAGVVPDPALAPGMLVMTRFACDPDRLQEILSYPDQNELYGSYENYSRDYLTSRDDFLDGTSSELGWEGFIHVKNGIVGEYTEVFRTDFRRVPVGGDAPLLLGQTWIPFPGTFVQEERSFKQDYQLEIFIPVEDGDYVHIYPVWREMDYGFVGTTESAAVQSVTMGQMVDFDKNTARLCEEGLP